jgi:hypothetical protein
MLLFRRRLLATRGESNGVDVLSQGVFSPFSQKNITSSNYLFLGGKYAYKTTLAGLKNNLAG